MEEMHAVMCEERAQASMFLLSQHSWLIPMSSPVWKLSKPHPFGAFIEISLHSLAWLIHFPLVFKLNLQFLIPLQRLGVGRWWVRLKVLKGWCKPCVTLGLMTSGGEDFDPGSETRLDYLEFLRRKVLLKYNRDRESCWHRHQKGTERVPAC